MGKKIDVYNLGLLGVNVDASPVHLNEGELLRAQNWAVDPAGVGGGLRRRDGHAHLNAVALNGAVKGLIAVPLPDNSALARKIYLPYSDANVSAKNWRTSSALAAWVDETVGAKPQQRDDLGTLGASFGGSSLRWATLNNKIYYPGHDYVGLATYPTIHVWDGTNDYTLTYITPNPNTPTTVPPGVLSIIPFTNTQLLISTYDGTGGVGHGRVMVLDVTTGTLTTIGPETDTPLCLCPFVYQGRIWIGSYNLSGGSPGKVYWARIDDTAWTLDKDFSDATFAESTHGYCYGMAAFKGDLYSGWGADVGSSGVIRKRATAAGAWTTVHSSDGTGTSNYCGPLITSKDGTKIYAYQWSVSGGANPIGRILVSNDGSVWTQDYSAGNVSGVQNAGQPILDPNGSGDIFWCLSDPSGGSDGRFVQNSGGVYTTKDTSKFYRGPICFLKV